MFETKIEPRWYTAAITRCSVRRYTGAPDGAALNKLGAFTRQISYQGVRVVLLQGPGLPGRIHGTDIYAAIVGGKSAPRALEGYVGEALALEAAAMGLGTCWLGSFSKNVVRLAAKVSKDERLSCIMAIGACAPQSPHHKRRPLTQTCGLDEDARCALPAWQQAALECAAIAPSACNLQPWRLQAEPGSLAVNDGGNLLGLGEIGRGIAMLHVAAGALSSNVRGVWREGDKGWIFRANV
ncbi:MAG: nitroreductase family protein [Oscillospiraceae bacterium]|jgi:hypothetical protein|nr:nitroreductase family protein [Oscillospiraceae bacterium]